MNRVEKEHLDQVVVACSTSDNSPLMTVVNSMTSVVGGTKRLLTGELIEIPEEMQESLQANVTLFETTIASYQDLGGKVKAANEKMNAIIANSMNRSKSTASSTSQAMGKAKNAASEVRGGVQ